ncbi:MAG: alginate O-acetyltransferase AlgX-related protein [Eubacteriales bacterium]
MKYIKSVFFVLLLTASVIIGACNNNTPAERAERIEGKNGYSFSSGNEFYDFRSDYNGELVLSDTQLSTIYRQLTRRALALSNSGVTYLIAVIPMAQTVYDRYLPSSFNKDRTVPSRLEQLANYINERNAESENKILFCNLTDALKSVTENDGLYNKNDGVITAKGGYYAYAEIYHHLPSEITHKNALIADPTAVTDGRYAVMGSESSILSTYVKIEYKNIIPTNPSLLIDCMDKSDRDALLPYFSSTFGGMGYRQNYEYNMSALNIIAPKAVIQVIREEMLHLLWDDIISLSYENGLKPGDDPYTTMKPQVLETVMTSKDVACIMGTVEAGSVITVSGENFETYTETAQNERFFIDVKIPKNGLETVRLTARLEGKEESSITEVYLEYDVNAESRTVFAGRMSQLHYPYTLEDYYGSNLFSEKELERIGKVMNNRLKSVRKASGTDTKLVYLIAPNSLTIYPETATDDMKAKKVSDNSRLRQFAALAKTREDDDILIIDLADYMKTKKDLGKLYYQTDTHWNTFGAYFGYYGLMTAIFEDSGIKGTAPYELERFNVYQSIQSSGDLCNFLGINNSVVSEYVTTCSADFPLTAVRDTDSIGSEVMRTGDTSLPKAVVMRDSFGAALISFVSEHFNEITFMPPGSGVDTSILKAAQPDYFIQVLVERNLGSLLG